MLDAAEQLIRLQGVEGFTVADLVKRAESSIGSFYARFEDKDALVRVVQDRVLTRIETVLEASTPKAWAGASLEECVSKVVTSLAFGVEEGPLFHAFLLQSTRDSVMRDRGRRFARKLCELFRAAVTPHRKHIRHADPELAVDFAYAMCMSVLERRLLWGRSASPDDLARPELVRELTRTVSAYLRSSPPAAHGKPAPRRRALND
jgi:AcrR family transcriptional regulator